MKDEELYDMITDGLDPDNMEGPMSKEEFNRLLAFDQMLKKKGKEFQISPDINLRTTILERIEMTRKTGHNRASIFKMKIEVWKAAAILIGVIGLTVVLNNTWPLDDSKIMMGPNRKDTAYIVQNSAVPNNAHTLIELRVHEELMAKRIVRTLEKRKREPLHTTPYEPSQSLRTFHIQDLQYDYNQSSQSCADDTLDDHYGFYKI